MSHARLAKKLSSLKKAPYKEKYETAIELVAADTELHKLDNSQVELDNKIVRRKSDNLLVSADNQRHLQAIRSFIEQFLNDPQNLAATINAYTSKIIHLNKLIETELNVQCSLLDKFSTYLKKIQQSMSCIPELCDDYKAWHEQFKHDLAQYAEVESVANDVLFNFEEENTVADVIKYAITDLKKRINGCEARQKANLKKLQTIQDPPCFSVAVLKNEDSNKIIYLMSVSSPECNAELLERLNKFTENFPQFCLSESASENFQLFLQSIRESIGLDKPRNPMRACSEKSLFSTLTKLKGIFGTKLSIEFIINFAFYPRDKAVAEHESEYIEILRNGKSEVMKIIPPCADCHINMPAAHVILSKPELWDISPLKKVGQFSKLEKSPTKSGVQQSDIKQRASIPTRLFCE